MRFRALDGFRGLCALVVCLFHFPVYSHLMAPAFFLPNAQMLLDFFFVMSGFIIAASYGDKLKRWKDVETFAIRRFARLWPLHAAVLAGFVIVELAKLVFAPHAGLNPPFTGRNAPEAILTSLLLIHSLDIHSQLVWNAPSWTISVEFYTYLVYGALVVAWPRRPLLGAASMAIVGFLGVAFVARQLAANYDYGIFRCFYGFFCGVLIWRLWLAAPLLRALRPAAATLLETGMMVGVFAFMALWGGPPFGFAGPLVFSAFILVYAAEGGLMTAALRWPPLVRLGEISYSLYLVHYLVAVCIGLTLKSLERFLHVDFSALGGHGFDDVTLIQFRSKWFMDGVSMAYLALVILVSTQTYRFIEEPGRRFFSKLRLRKARPFAMATGTTGAAHDRAIS